MAAKTKPATKKATKALSVRAGFCKNPTGERGKDAKSLSAYLLSLAAAKHFIIAADPKPQQRVSTAPKRPDDPPDEVRKVKEPSKLPQNIRGSLEDPEVPKNQ